MQIYEVLRKDHEKVKTLLSELVALDESGEKRRHDLIQQIRDELVPHSRAEESVFYNSLSAIDSAKDVVMHGYQEHMEAETFLRTLQAADKIDMGWKQTAKKLKEAVFHHIEEEENKIFTVAQHLFTDEEAVMMAEAFEQLKPEVREQGFMQTTIDMVANLMPPRFAATLRTMTLNPH